MEEAIATAKMTMMPTFPYQVSFSYVEKGKHIASSKRVLSYKFGLADGASLKQGLQGIACCGEEHLVTAVWSVRSGKLRITINDKIIPVHLDSEEKVINSSKTNMKKAVNVSWTFRLPSDAAAGPPASPTPSSRQLHLQFIGYAAMPEHNRKQYDLIIDGCSFFKLPKLQQVGVSAYVYSRSTTCTAAPTLQATTHAPLSANIPRQPLTYLESVEAPSTLQEDEKFLQEALRRSQEKAPIKQRRQQQGVEEEKMDIDLELDQRQSSYRSYDGVEPLS
ncbi:hypothetical protein MPSEU_000910500 [Mayamaea pseudoterrestris]|nr:hypothetical protein MPSEU_000910500 [Mayamaea pseudoterrestris]